MYSMNRIHRMYEGVGGLACDSADIYKCTFDAHARPPMPSCILWMRFSQVHSKAKDAWSQSNYSKRRHCIIVYPMSLRTWQCRVCIRTDHRSSWGIYMCHLRPAQVLISWKIKTVFTSLIGFVCPLPLNALKESHPQNAWRSRRAGLWFCIYLWVYFWRTGQAS